MKKPQKLTLLFCMNDRGSDRVSCAASGANALRKYAKDKTADDNRIKIKKAGCLGHCKRGPVVEILPAKDYYRCVDKEAIDQLFDGRIGAGKTVGSILIKAGKQTRKK